MDAWFAYTLLKIRPSNVANIIYSRITVITQNGGITTICPIIVENNWGNKSEALVSYWHVLGYSSNF